MNLSELFFETAGRYTGNRPQLKLLWEEIQSAYSDKTRHYHTLAHLQNLYVQLSDVKKQLENWDAVVFALFYHDAVYSMLLQNNEEKSAELAEERLVAIRVPKETVARCVQHILATKSHTISGDNDTNLFTDADLGILGAPPDIYRMYAQQVRAEFWMYPDLVYKPGRKRILQNFLDMKRIFKTDYFFTQFETQARENIRTEVESLQ